MHTHLQGDIDVDRAIAHGRNGMTALAGVRSDRATGYLNDLKQRLAPWQRTPVVVDFLNTPTTA